MQPRPIAISALLAALAATALTGSALAQSDGDRATARAMAEQAQNALDAKDFTRAQELFERATALVRAPTLELGRARSLAGMGRLVAAHEAYQRIVREGVPADASPAFAKAVEDARGEIAALARRLPSVVLRVDGPAASSAEVEIDGVRVAAASLGAPRFVDPGSHVLRASAPGFSTSESTFTVREAESAELPIVLRAVGTIAAASPRETTTEPSRSRDGVLAAGFVTGGVGVAALGIAAVTGALYLGAEGDVDDHCDDAGRCDAEGIDAASSGETLGAINTVALFGGLAALGGGVALVVWAYSGEEAGAASAPPRPTLRARSWASPSGGGLLTEGSF